MSREVELVHALADGELSPAEEAEAKQLLANSPQLRAEYEWARTLKSSLGANCKPINNEEGWSRCVDRLDELDRVNTTENFVGKWAWMFCAALVLMIFAGGIVSRTVGSRTVTNTQIAGLLDPSANLPRGEAPKMDAVNHIDLSGFTRVSASGGYLENSRPFVRYGLRDRLGLGGLAIVVIQGADRVEGVDKATSNPLIKAGQLNGTNCVTWSVQGNTCVLFGERPMDELQAFAEDMLQ